MNAIAYALSIFNLIKAAVGAGMAVKDAYDLIVKYEANVRKMDEEGRGPTDAEWAEINTESEELRANRPNLTDGE